MCGLYGFLADGADDTRRARVSRTTARLRLRSPDAEGIHIEPGVALGHRRLSILDLSSTGAQPMSVGSLYGVARDAILAPDCVEAFGFSRDALETTLMEHCDGRRERGFSLWKIFQLALWARECQ